MPCAYPNDIHAFVHHQVDLELFVFVVGISGGASIGSQIVKEYPPDILHEYTQRPFGASNESILGCSFPGDFKSITLSKL
jgi:hypothetical protein